MALTIFTTPTDSFWHDQDLKLRASPLFKEEHGGYDDDIWFFSKGKSKTSIDFSVFDLPAFNLESPASLKTSQLDRALSSKQYAKLFCSIVLTPKNADHVGPAYQMVMHLFAFLKEQGEVALSVPLLVDFWSSFMSRVAKHDGFFKRVSIPAYRSSIRPVPFMVIRNKLKALGVDGVIGRDLTVPKVESSLDNVCIAKYNIKLNEYKKGGSFNHLGLELGQYYVDYLNRVYQNNFLYTAVCQRAIGAVFEHFGIPNIKESVPKNRLFKVILAGLQGKDLGKSRYNTDPHTQGINHQELKVMTEKLLVSEYGKRFDAVTSLKDASIHSLVIELGLSERFDAVEVIRVLMLQKYLGLQGRKSPGEVWNGYLSSLDKLSINSQSLNTVSVDDVYDKMTAIVSEDRLTSKECLASIQKWVKSLLANSANNTFQSLKKSLAIQLHAISALVIAWTGYRMSEYGFPLSAIQTEPNLDILDSAYVPFRFKLKWLVPKTNALTKIDREVTSQCYQLAAQLNEVFGHVRDEPCLYALTSTRGDKQTAYDSSTYVEARVKANWAGFINYPPFNDVVRLEELRQEGRVLTALEQTEFDALAQKYPVDSARYRHLLLTAKEVKRDWLRLSHSSFNGPKIQEKFKKSLVAFVRRCSLENNEHERIIKQYLSNETRALLLSGEANLNDKKTMSDIMAELLNGVRHPSPHAFRHIWAEAVLTRYQGDVGAVIRHQFCHLDASFFMAYLRDKEPRGFLKLAEQRYLNSIVLELMSSHEFEEKQIGGVARFVKKLIGSTKVRSDSEVHNLRDAILGRIISVQPSRFVVCMPRDGAEGRAKCAKMGTLNPQDAKLEFCLNCANGLITEGNIRGIWVTIQPMIKEALQPNGIGFLLEAHLPALTSSWKRIKELRNNKNADKVDLVLSEIKGAIDAIHHKVQEEKKRYG
ncbi:hypothetical protein ACEV76_17570 [Vibrio parahaemolyticus]|uniref:hypothetical protein n=1 Tax=Vibrio parahaemolyticus TaxID=670 RepID=UPI000A37571F|nr:hypothetical protein [Vibrio parahaemolyticus]OUJ63504.1 hypothetical protein BTO03_00075 [Vibrio parahaemolyticus]TOA42467.1 hypothetical protein CGK28_00075 [Vibrio parahaemolyticus]HCH6177420.1 hypothetical protein [Vibrio parahaemolyticus]